MRNDVLIDPESHLLAHLFLPLSLLVQLVDVVNKPAHDASRSKIKYAGGAKRCEVRYGQITDRKANSRNYHVYYPRHLFTYALALLLTTRRGWKHILWLVVISNVDFILAIHWHLFPQIFHLTKIHFVFVWLVSLIRGWSGIWTYDAISLGIVSVGWVKRLVTESSLLRSNTARRVETRMVTRPEECSIVIYSVTSELHILVGISIIIISILWVLVWSGTAALIIIPGEEATNISLLIFLFRGWILRNLKNNFWSRGQNHFSDWVCLITVRLLSMPSPSTQSCWLRPMSPNTKTHLPLSLMDVREHLRKLTVPLFRIQITIETGGGMLAWSLQVQLKVLVLIRHQVFTDCFIFWWKYVFEEDVFCSQRHMRLFAPLIFFIHFFIFIYFTIL